MEKYMKHRIFVILILALSVLIISELFRVRTKEAMSAEEFTLRMEAKGYTVRNNYNEPNHFNVETSLIAELGGLRVHFTVHETIRDAGAQYSAWRYFIRGSHLERISRMGRRSYREVRGENFNKITSVRGEGFSVFVWVDNTILSISTGIENRTAAEALLNTLGY